MNRREKAFQNIGVLVIGIFVGTALAVAVFLGAIGKDEPEPERENYRITERRTEWVSNVKAW